MKNTNRRFKSERRDDTVFGFSMPTSAPIMTNAEFHAGQARIAKAKRQWRQTAWKGQPAWMNVLDGTIELADPRISDPSAEVI